MDANQGGTKAGQGARLLSVVGKVLAVAAVAGVVGFKAWGHFEPRAGAAAPAEGSGDVLAELEREGVISAGARKAAAPRLDQRLARDAESGGDLGGMMRAQRRWLTMMNKEAARIDGTRSDLADAPGFGDCHFESVRQVEQAIALAKAAEVECLKVERLARRAPDVLKVLLEEEGVSKAAARGFMSGAGEALGMTAKARECETTVVRAARGQLEILRDQWGAWGIDEGGLLAFDDGAAEKRYLELQQEIENAGAESARLTKELSKVKRQR